MKKENNIFKTGKAVGSLLTLLLFFAFNSFGQIGQDRQLADQYLNNAEYEKAAQLYDKLMDKDPYGTYPQYYRCLLAMKDYSTVEKLTKKMVKKQETNLSYLVDLGYVYAQMNQPEKAKVQYEKAIKSLTPDQNQVIILASSFLNKQETDYALQTYLEGRKMMREIYGFYFETAEVYYQKGNYAAMIEEYLDAVADNPMMQQNVLNVLQSRVGFDPENNRGDMLRTALLRRIQRSPEKTELPEMLIWYFIQQKDFDSAFIQAKAVDKRMKEDGSRVLSIGSMAASNMNYDAAIKCYQYVVEKGKDNNNYIPARMELLNTYNKKITLENNYTKADLLKLEGDYESTLAELGRSGRTAGLVKGLAHLRAFYLDKIDTAMSDLEEAIDYPNIQAQTKADCKLELGDIYLFSGNVWDSDLLYAQVDKDFKHDALGQEAKFRGARLDYFRGDFLWAQAQLDVLKSATSQLIANDALSLSLLISDNMGLDSTTDALMLYARADLLSYRNKNDDALVILDSLHILYPNHSLVDDAWYKEAQIMDMKRNYIAEDSLYGKILAYDSASVIADDALYQRAILHETKLNDKAKALELYQDLIVKYPGSVFVVESRKKYRALRGDVLN
ncbi:MAG: tetratricopeptide repeat protein [Bacteroidetes bacterium]|nr:tetratricopeptide repeat protein [Bacteroidota bacterium]